MVKVGSRVWLKFGSHVRIDFSIFPGMVWVFGIRNKHFEDGEQFSRRAFEFRTGLNVGWSESGFTTG